MIKKILPIGALAIAFAALSMGPGRCVATEQGQSDELRGNRDGKAGA